MSEYLSFRLHDEFVDRWAKEPVDWGFPIGAGNSLGELTYITKYSRLKPDGSKERWHETCRRVIEGMYSILKDHCTQARTPWNHNKAMRSAEDAFERMFRFKWLPPGRGLWMMGTALVHEERNSAPLQNCAFISTETLGPRNPTLPFIRLMEMSMYGVGVGFDTRGAGLLTVHEPQGDPEVFMVPDTREGWCESVDLLLRSYFLPHQAPVEFDYSLLRPAGAPLKRFGGVSAGPGPLRRLHEQVRDLFVGRAGDPLRSTDIVDICNLEGKCVVAGNIRRSAEIALGNHDDKDFLALKDWQVNPERMGPDGWGNLSNNSVFANVGDDLAHLVDLIAENGEPGIMWLDLARQFGRLADEPTNKDYRVAGCNPCVTGDTWVMTQSGPRRVDALVGQEVPLLINGVPYASSAFFVTGTREIVRVDLQDGRYLRCTPDHLVLVRTSNGDTWFPAGDLASGDRVVLHRHWKDEMDCGHSWSGPGSFEEGYLLGHLVGDGTFSSDGRAVLNVWERDVGNWPVRSHLLQSVQDLGVGAAFRGWRGPFGNGWYALSTASLTDLASKYGIVKGSKTVTDSIEESSSDFTRGFLRGLFDADGSVQGAQSKGVSVRLAQSNRPMLVAVQRMLGRLGINSVIYLRRDEGERTLPDGKGGKDSYWCKTAYDLVVAKDNLARFQSRVGFTHAKKRERLDASLSSYKRFLNRDGFTSVVASVREDGIEDVYDVSVDTVHAFDANGLFIHNCAEQPLENHELCTLVETFPYRHDSLEDYKRTLKYAYMYGKAVTLLPTPWPESNEVMTRNRRIGTSMTGVVQFAEAYGWPHLRQWCDEAYAEVVSRDIQYSEWLGVRESIKSTTVKPSGTVSLLAHATPGVHWPVASNDYIRRQRFRVGDPSVEIFRDAGYPVEPDVMDPEYTVVISFPTTGPNVRSESEVSVWEKVALAALMGRHWSDNMVSATFTFRPEEKGQISAILRAFDGQLKTMSFLPIDQGTYEQMPYEAIEPERFRVLRKPLREIDWNALYGSGQEAEGEKFCTTDVCEIPRRA